MLASVARGPQAAAIALSLCKKKKKKCLTSSQDPETFHKTVNCQQTSCTLHRVLCVAAIVKIQKHFNFIRLTEQKKNKNLNPSY